MLDKWAPVIIQLVSAAFFMGIAWGEIRAIRNAQALSDDRNREDHGKIYERLDDHSERIAKVERGCEINHSTKTRGAHAN